MSKTEPNYPASFYAKLFNLTERRIQQMAKEGIIPKAARGKYPLIGVIQSYVKFLQERALKAEKGELDLDVNPQLEKALLDRERRKGVALQNAIKEGGVFPVVAGKFVFSKIGAEMAVCLDKIPGAIKKALPGTTATQMDKIKKELAKARNSAVKVCDRFDEFLDDYHGEAEA